MDGVVAFPLTVTPVTIAFPLVTVVIEYAPRGTAMSIEPLRVVPARWRRALLRSNVRSPVSVLEMATSPGDPEIETSASRFVMRSRTPAGALMR